MGSRLASVIPRAPRAPRCFAAYLTSRQLAKSYLADYTLSGRAIIKDAVADHSSFLPTF